MYIRKSQCIVKTQFPQKYYITLLLVNKSFNHTFLRHIFWSLRVQWCIYKSLSHTQTKTSSAESKGELQWIKIGGGWFPRLPTFPPFLSLNPHFSLSTHSTTHTDTLRIPAAAHKQTRTHIQQLYIHTYSWCECVKVDERCLYSRGARLCSRWNFLLGILWITVKKTWFLWILLGCVVPRNPIDLPLDGE